MLSMTEYVTPQLAAFIIFGSSIAYLFILSAYRTIFHPLAAFPGPILWKTSRLFSAYYHISGTLPYKLSELHERYGPVIQVSPHELSFIHEEAWQDIYGRPMPRNTQLRRDDMQFLPPINHVDGLISAQDDEDHARLRRNFNPGFSEKAIRDQEPVVLGYVDLLMQRLRENCQEPVEMCKWFNFTTFDVIADLTFGESFENLKTSKLHIWATTIFLSLKTIIVLGFARNYGFDTKMFNYLPKRFTEKRREHIDVTTAKMKKRPESDMWRPDFLTTAHKQLNQPGGISMKELDSTLGTLIFAGSETTATLLSGAVYYICAHPLVLQKLQHEIRGTFQDKGDINMVSVNQLPYMLAMISEVLRIYPPVAISFNRRTPPHGCTIAGHHVPGDTLVGINHWAISHSSIHFKDPYKFRPERWLGPSESGGDNRKASQPFSVGPRNCIGKILAYAEIKLIIARLIWEFDVELGDGMKAWVNEQKIYVVYKKPELFIKLRPVVR